MSGLKLLGPNGSDAVTLQNTQNVTKTVDVTDVASDVFVKGRVGSAGVLGFRNQIVDGRFDFWYEGTSQTSSGYGSDTMWYNQSIGSTKVHTQQPLVAGVDLPAIECPSAKYFSRTVVTSVVGAGNSTVKMQNIEGVGTLAGKTATLSFYAKADAAKNISIEFQQNFGTGGSPSTTNAGIGGQTVAITTTWQRYSRTVSIPSISGKTLGTVGDMLQVMFGFDIGSTYSAMYGGMIQQSGTFDIACVQLEEGSVATPFEELPIEISQTRVNRYYQKIGGESQYDIILQCYSIAGSYVSIEIILPTRMRVSPAKAKVGTWVVSNCAQPAINVSSSTQTVFLNALCTTSGGIQFNTVDTTTYIALDARL